MEVLVHWFACSRVLTDTAEQEQLGVPMTQLRSKISGLMKYLKESEFKGYKLKEGPATYGSNDNLNT